MIINEIINTPQARRLVTNAGTLLTGNFVSSAIGLLSFGLTARSLIPSEFGILVLISTYVAIIERLVSFQTWQAYIKYGAQALERGNDARLCSVLVYCLKLEAASLIVGAMVGVGGSFILPEWIEWLAAHQGWAAIYSLTILFRFKGISTGILRLANAFVSQTVVTIATAIARLACIVTASLTGKGLEAFLAAWITSELIGSLIQGGVAAKVFLRRDTRGRRNQADHASLSAANRRELRGYMWATSIEGTIRTVRGFDIPMLGTILSAEAAGFYALARRVGGMLTMTVDTSFQAIYPDLARFSSNGRHTEFRSLVKHATVIFGIVGLVALAGFLAIGDWLFQVGLQPSYAAAVSPATWCLVGGVVWAFAHPYWPALLALGRAKLLVFGQLGVTLTYLGLTFVLALESGPTGAAVAFALTQAAWGVWLWLTFRYCETREVRQGRLDEQV